jgi:glutathione-specific gamma-glutamylcyclotransferase
MGMSDGSVMWVFGYGSLMWNPGFAFADRRRARLDGFHRCFCMRSVHHRGTPEHPGLVLALDAQRGAVCEGLAFAVPGADAPEVLDALRQRELISSAYLEARLPLQLQGGNRVEAVTFIVDPQHVQYCGTLDLEEQAGIIARAVGGRGPNTEYLWNTADHLAELGIHDADLTWLSSRVRELVSR